MNHDAIETRDLAARYVAERLTADEEQEFEAHLVECARCADDVELELGLREGLRVAQSELMRPSPTMHVPRRAWMRSNPRLLQAAAVVLLATAVGLGVSLARTSASLRAALAGAREQQQQADMAARTAQSLQRRLGDLEQQAVKATAAAPASVRPVAVFALTAVRGPAAADRPINRIGLTGADRLVVFTLDLPPVPAPNDYVVSLSDGGGRSVWKGGPLRPSSPDTLAVAVDRMLLSDGIYVLELDHRPSAGRPVPIGRYPFEITSR